MLVLCFCMSYWSILYLQLYDARIEMENNATICEANPVTARFQHANIFETNVCSYTQTENAEDSAEDSAEVQNKNNGRFLEIEYLNIKKRNGLRSQR